MPTTAASLAIEAASVRVFPIPQKKDFGYEVRFLLSETAGKSGATIQDIFVRHADGGGDHTGPGCWQDICAFPGRTLDIFYTDDGITWLGYCAPYRRGMTETPELQVWVSFADDSGRGGVVQAPASVMK